MNKLQHYPIDNINPQYHDSYRKAMAVLDKYGLHIGFNRRENYVPFFVAEINDDPYFPNETDLADWVEESAKNGDLDWLFDINKLPLKHPELFFRLTGEWKGWHDFLGPQSKESTYRDKLEDMMFQGLMNSRYKDTSYEIMELGWEDCIEAIKKEFGE